MADVKGHRVPKGRVLASLTTPHMAGHVYRMQRDKCYFRGNAMAHTSDGGGFAGNGTVHTTGTCPCDGRGPFQKWTGACTGFLILAEPRVNPFSPIPRKLSKETARAKPKYVTPLRTPPSVAVQGMLVRCSRALMGHTAHH